MLIYEESRREHYVGFYPTLNCAIKAFVDRKIRECNATSIHELLNYIKSLQSRLNKALQPLNLEVVEKKGGKKNEN